jgi:hypothetical protein
MEVYTSQAVSKMSQGQQNPVSGRPPTFPTFNVAKLKR